MVEPKLKAMWAIDVDLTGKLELKDVTVGVLRPVEDDPHPVTTYKALLKFQSEMQVNHRELEQAFSLDAIAATVVAYMRPALLRCLFDYLVEHDSPDLAALEGRVRGETIHEMARSQFPPRE